MRGQLFEIEEKKIFTFGGARSHDISGGILEMDAPDFEEKRKKIDKGWKLYRINHLSWWKQEMPTEDEMEEGRRNLQAHGNKVDFIISHCCASSTQAYLSAGTYEPDILTKYFNEIQRSVKYKNWFFGHYHDNRNLAGGEILIYEQIIRVV